MIELKLTQAEKQDLVTAILTKQHLSNVFVVKYPEGEPSKLRFVNKAIREGRADSITEGCRLWWEQVRIFVTAT